jgi:hypothetical protein
MKNLLVAECIIMRHEYCITILESFVEYDLLVRSEATHIARTVLWPGNDPPEPTVIESFLEGQKGSIAQPDQALGKLATYINVEKNEEVNSDEMC